MDQFNIARLRFRVANENFTDEIEEQMEVLKINVTFSHNL